MSDPEKPPVVHAIDCDLGEDCSCGAYADRINAMIHERQRRAAARLRRELTSAAMQSLLKRDGSCWDPEALAAACVSYADAVLKELIK